MVSHLFFYQLTLLAIIWVFVILHLSWVSDQGDQYNGASHTHPPKRTRSTEPKAFTGLTHKPHWALCERAPCAHTASSRAARPHAPDKPPSP